MERERTGKDNGEESPGERESRKCGKASYPPNGYSAYLRDDRRSCNAVTALTVLSRPFLRAFVWQIPGKPRV